MHPNRKYVLLLVVYGLKSIIPLIFTCRVNNLLPVRQLKNGASHLKMAAVKLKYSKEEILYLYLYIYIIILEYINRKYTTIGSN